MSSNSKPRISNSGAESLWTWNTIKKSEKKKAFPFTEFIHDAQSKLQEVLHGPGAGAGIGCGAGFGAGLVGGVGFGGWGWNEVTVVVGFGFGCGVGVGVGYGKGIGYGVSMESLGTPSSSPSRKRLNSDKRIINL
ncbi:hypothetical protein MLD38_024405 [Melastoma candidum]|uniref:Uncharacterized protein n=1 Tax=Melastoma candidum TaxID=119954 RepID=A0ACB9NS96_9MYRT|nr:hypothetical protein MLD38_024405 [Melastoma candidum]